MDMIDLEDDTIDAEVLDALAVSMDNFRVSRGLSLNSNVLLLVTIVADLSAYCGSNCLCGF